jgi:hypothetical protein
MSESPSSTESVESPPIRPTGSQQTSSEDSIAAEYAEFLANPLADDEVSSYEPPIYWRLI